MKLTIETEKEVVTLVINGDDVKVTSKCKNKTTENVNHPFVGGLKVGEFPIFGSFNPHPKSALNISKETSDAINIDPSYVDRLNNYIGNLLQNASKTDFVFINKDVFNYDLYSDDTKQKLDNLVKYLLGMTSSISEFDLVIVNQHITKKYALSFNISLEIIESKGFYDWVYDETNRQYKEAKDKQSSIKPNLAIEKLFKMSFQGDSSIKNNDQVEEAPNDTARRPVEFKPAPSAYTTRSVCTDFGIKETFHNQLEALMKDVIESYPHIQKNYPDQFDMVINSLASKQQLNKHFLATREFKEWFNTRLVQEIQLNNL